MSLASEFFGRDSGIYDVHIWDLKYQRSNGLVVSVSDFEVARIGDPDQPHPGGVRKGELDGKTTINFASGIEQEYLTAEKQTITGVS